MHYEYSLVFFTVFGQLAAGIALMIFLTGLSKNPEKEKQAWIMSLVFGVIAMIGSTLHLSSLGGGIYLITKIGSSWIAIEVAIGAIFGALVLLRILNKIKASLNALVAITGLAFVGAMTQVYKVDIVPLWYTCGTELSFFGTAFLLGSVFIAPFVASENEDKPLRLCSVLFFVGTLASASLPIFWIEGVIPLAAMQTPVLASFVIMSLCVGLSMLGLHVLGGLPLLMAPKNIYLFYGGAGLALIGSFIGRMLFYAANIKLGIL